MFWPGAVLKRVKSYGLRSYIPEKRQKGKRRWQGKAEEQQATYENRRRVQGDYGKRLLKRRGELVERSFAHCYETGWMRRCHLRGRENVLKRQLAHVSAFDLSLVMRQLLGAGTPRELKKSRRTARFALSRFSPARIDPGTKWNPKPARFSPRPEPVAKPEPDAGWPGIQLLAPRTGRLGTDR
jgi:hypothetical protein